VFFGFKRLIGVDVGSRFIKLAEVTYSPKGSKLLNLAITPTPEGAFSGAELTSPELIAGAIVATLNTEKFKGKKIATGLYGPSVMVKKITMPKIEKNILAQQIRWEAEQYIPFDLNQIVLAHHINSSSSEADSQNVLIIAAQNLIVNTTKQLAKMANLDLQVLDLSSFALANAYEFTAPQAKGGVILAHVGAHITHVVIYSVGQVEFVREITFGSHNCTLEIHKEMGLSIDESESLKIGASRGEEVPEDVLRYIDSFNQTISEEIKNSLDYFMGSQNEGMSISQIILSGGGAKTLGLSEKMSSVVDLPVNFMNLMEAFSFISPKARMIGDDLNFFCPIAIGLSLRRKGDR
jgi:type IV pilus assembly protein PilM